MTAKILKAALLLSLLITVGCSDVEKDGAIYRIEPKIEAQIMSQGYNIPDPGEVDIVEEMAGFRNAYKEGLEKLVDFYSAAGDTVKLSWAQRELKSLTTMPQYKYIMPAITADANLRAMDLIPAADELYNEANQLYKEAGILLVIVNESKMRLALSKFNELIGLYPTSDKIDDAAYKAGRIYDRFGDYIIASVYYQRAFQWNEQTPYAARSRAAYIMDRRLRKYDKALELYRLAYKYEKRYPNNVEFAQERINALTKSQMSIDNDNPEILEPQNIQDLE